MTLAGGSVDLDGAIALASGKLKIEAERDLRLGAQSRLDLAGREVVFYDQTRYTWGGDLTLDSASGNIDQEVGSVIDLSARKQRGGTLAATALGAGAGRIDLRGSILGGASGLYDAGGTRVPYDAAEITLRARTLADFAGLNTRLNAGQVHGARRFQIKQGDLILGDEVRARQVSITVDGGSLTVAGRIDASGFQPGIIRLAARGDLNLLGTLDAHGAGLRRDSHGQIIDSPNRAQVSLTSSLGTLTLGPSASIDLRAGTEAAGNDGARGTLDLNARRLGGARAATARAPMMWRSWCRAGRRCGRVLIAVNAFREYADAELASAPDVSGSKPQLITQDMLIRIDRDSQDFINAALATALRARLAGLDGYRLRPGVDIVSDPLINPAGNLTVVGDLDLSGLRYGGLGPQRSRAARLRRTGRAEHPRGRRPDHSRQHQRRLRPAAVHARRSRLVPVRVAQCAEQRQHAVRRRYRDSHRRRVAGQGHRVPQGRRAELRPAGRGRHLAKGIALPVAVELAGNYVLPAGVVLGADVYHGDGSVAWRAGTVPTADVTLAPGMKLGAGTVLRAETLAAALTWQGRGLARADDGQRRAGAGARRLDSGHDQDRAARRQAGQPAAEDGRVPGRQLGAGADAAAGRHQLEPAADGRCRPGLGRSARGRSGVARFAGAGRLSRLDSHEDRAGRRWTGVRAQRSRLPRGRAGGRTGSAIATSSPGFA